MSRDIDRADESAFVFGEMAREAYQDEFSLYLGDNYRPAPRMSRDALTAGLLTHLEAMPLATGHPDSEHHAALEILFPGWIAFGLKDTAWGGGDSTRWLIACDWLQDRDGGDAVAQAMRAAIIS